MLKLQRADFTRARSPIIRTSVRVATTATRVLVLIYCSLYFLLSLSLAYTLFLKGINYFRFDPDITEKIGLIRTLDRLWHGKHVTWLVVVVVVAEEECLETALSANLSAAGTNQQAEMFSSEVGRNSLDEGGVE